MASTDNEVLEIVDSDDLVTGLATRKEIHERGLFHRTVHVFVFNSRGCLYVQRRSASKDRHALKLDSSAAGHVDPGESYPRAAERELLEELGLSISIEEVLRVGACATTDNEHVVLYAGSTDIEPLPNTDEIVWGGFMTATDLSRQMEANPEDFVPAFVMLWRAYRRKHP